MLIWELKVEGSISKERYKREMENWKSQHASSEKRICWISLGGRRRQNLHGKPRHSIVHLPHFPHSAGGSWAYWKPEVCNGSLICLQTYITDAADRFYHVPHRIFEFTFYPTMPAEYVLTNDAPPPLPGIVGLLQSPLIAIGLKVGFRELSR